MTSFGQVNTALLVTGTHRDGSARIEVRQSIASRDLHPGQRFTSAQGTEYAVALDGSVRRVMRRRARGASARQIRIATKARREAARIAAKNQERVSANG